LGNSAGIPGDVQCQQGLINTAMDMIEQAKSPRTTIQSSYKWPGDKQWKEDYSNPDKLSSEEIQRRRTAFDSAKKEAKALRRS